MKYKIVYGNRRFEACKKLGWKTIEAKIDGNQSEMLKISDMDSFKNTRNSKVGIIPLMQNIRDNGLLEPIGVTKSKKFSTKELILNGIENLQRHELNPLEKGKLFTELKKSGLTEKQIATRLNISTGTVIKNIGYFKSLPDKFKKNVGEYSVENRDKTPERLVIAAFGKTTDKKLSTKILNNAIKKKWTAEKTRVVTRLCNTGLTYEKATEIDKYITLKTEIAVNRIILKKIQAEYKLNRSELVRRMFQGKIPLNKKLVI